MRVLVKLLALGAPLLSMLCLGAEASVSKRDSTSPPPSPANGVGTSMPIQTQMGLSEATTEDPTEDDTGTASQAGPMPFFVEVTQTTTMAGTFLPPPSIQVGPSNYSYIRQGKILLLNSRIDPDLAITQLLIGETTILQMPTQSHENREIYQYPPAQPNLLEVLKFDAEAGMLELLYAGEIHSLAPEETLTFKRTGAGSNAPTIVTMLVHHGRLADIQDLSADGSLR